MIFTLYRTQSLICWQHDLMITQRWHKMITNRTCSNLYNICQGISRNVFNIVKTSKMESVKDGLYLCCPTINEWKQSGRPRVKLQGRAILSRFCISRVTVSIVYILTRSRRTDLTLWDSVFSQVTVNVKFLFCNPPFYVYLLLAPYAVQNLFKFAVLL